MFKDVKNPRWAGKDHAQIIFDVMFTEEEGWVPFVASPDDCTTHGPLLYAIAANGRLVEETQDSEEERILRGEMDPWEGHRVIGGEIVNVAEMERQAEAELGRRLASMQTPQALAEAEVNPETASRRKEKLSALLAVKGQPGWPLKVEWPEDGDGKN